METFHSFNQSITNTGIFSPTDLCFSLIHTQSPWRPRQLFCRRQFNGCKGYGQRRTRHDWWHLWHVCRRRRLRGSCGWWCCFVWGTWCVDGWCSVGCITNLTITKQWDNAIFYLANKMVATRRDSYRKATLIRTCRDIRRVDRTVVDNRAWCDRSSNCTTQGATGVEKPVVWSI